MVLEYSITAWTFDVFCCILFAVPLVNTCISNKTAAEILGIFQDFCLVVTFLLEKIVVFLKSIRLQSKFVRFKYSIQSSEICNQLETPLI